MNKTDEAITRVKFGGAAAGMSGLFLLLDGFIPFLGSGILAACAYRAGRRNG